MVEIVTTPDKEQWNLYAGEHGAAKFSHLFDWGESLAATYSLSLFRLAAIDTTTHRISGILPLVLFNPPGKAIRLISLPYTDAAGMLANDGESSRQLLSAALKLADQLGALPPAFQFHPDNAIPSGDWTWVFGSTFNGLHQLSGNSGARIALASFGVVIGVAMVGNMIVAAFAGVLIPIVLEKAGADPALASGTFVTTITDVFGFFAFLGLAGIMLL